VRRERALSMEVWRDEDMVTWAEDSMLASATANPMPLFGELVLFVWSLMRGLIGWL